MFDFLKFWRSQNSTTGISIEDLKKYGPEFGSTVSVNAKNATTEATVFACIRVLSDTVAQMPCRLSTISGDGTRKADTQNPLYNVLRWSPCPWMTAYDYWKFNVTCMCLYGYHISKVIYSGNGKVRELLPINPAMIHEIRKNERTGRLEFVMKLEFQTPQGGTVGQREIVLVGGQDAFYTYYGTEDGITPISPIGQNAKSIGLSMTATQHGLNLFKNDATPPLIVKMPHSLTPEQAKRFVDTWQATGSRSGFGLPRILEQGADVERLTMSNEDAQYLETRQFQTDEIAGIFGVPPHMVGSQQQAKGWSTMEQLMTEFITLSINPWTTRFEQSINKHLIRRDNWGGTSAKFMTNTLLRGDSNARGNLYKTMFEVGAMNPNEIRTFEDLNPRTDENGEQFYVTANVKTPQMLENEATAISTGAPDTMEMNDDGE